MIRFKSVPDYDSKEILRDWGYSHSPDSILSEDIMMDDELIKAGSIIYRYKYKDQHYISVHGCNLRFLLVSKEMADRLCRKP